MTTCFKLYILLGLLASSSAYFTYDYKFMEIDCRKDRRILTYEVDVALKLFGGSSFGGYDASKCTAVLESDNWGKKLILKFSSLNLENGDTIDVYDGSSENSRKLTDSPLSGIDADFDKGFKSSGKYLTVVMNSHAGSATRDGFDAVVTEFETDYCFSYDYECCDGGCIDSGLRHDSEDNCVGSSDEWDVTGCLTVGALAGVIVGTIVGVILIITVITVCIYMQQKKARARRQNMPRPAPGTYPAQLPIHYSVQTQQVAMGVYPAQQQYYAPPPQAPYAPSPQAPYAPSPQAPYHAPAYPGPPLQPPAPGQDNTPPKDPQPAPPHQQ